MKVIAINGSPRKNHNTGTLLNKYLAGVKSVSDNIETKIIHLYDFEYKGCTECYACKLKGGKSYGMCGYIDEIHNLLIEVSNADIVVFGSPIFFYDITGELRSFIERLFYPFTAFKKDGKRVIAPKTIRTAFKYTMNVKEEEMKYSGYEQNLLAMHGWTAHVFGFTPEILYAYNTYQYKNYELYVADLWDVEGKRNWHLKQFPLDCKKSYELGKKMTTETMEEIL